MNQLRFDENLAIREVLDDIIGMVDRRERLIESAGDQAEKMKDDRMAEHVKKLEHLMSDFLTLFNPILVKVRGYAASLKESVSDSEAFLKSLVGIIDAGKTIDGSSATVQELEKDADEVQQELQESEETLHKIEDLFRRTGRYDHIETAKVDEAPSHESLRSRRALPSVGDRSSRPYVVSGPRFSSDESTKREH